MKFALSYFYDPAQTGPAEDGVCDRLGLDAEIGNAGAHVHGAGFHPGSTARTVSAREGRTSTEGGAA